MAIPEGFDVDDPTCPKCDGPMWDNREKKYEGEYPPSRSDFSCKDKDGCGKGIWIEDKKKGGGKKAPYRKPERERDERPRSDEGRQAAHQAAAPAAYQPKAKLSPLERRAHRDNLMSSYAAVMKLTAERMAKIAKQHELPLDMANVQAATWSQWNTMLTKGYLPDPDLNAAAAAANGARSARTGQPVGAEEVAPPPRRVASPPPEHRREPAAVATGSEFDDAAGRMHELDGADDELPF